MYSAFSEYRRTVHAIVVEPPLVAFNWTMAWTPKAAAEGQPAGEPLWNTGMSMAEYEGGLRRRWWLCSGRPRAGTPPADWGVLAPTPAGDTQTAAQIRTAIEAMFRAENQFATIGAEGVLAAWSATATPDCDGGTNGRMSSGEELGERDRRTYEGLPQDYQRSLDTLVVEPPFAAYRTTFSGTLATGPFSVTAINLGQFQGGKLRRFWTHHQPPAR